MRPSTLILALVVLGASLALPLASDARAGNEGSEIRKKMKAVRHGSRPGRSTRSSRAEGDRSSAGATKSSDAPRAAPTAPQPADFDSRTKGRVCIYAEGGAVVYRPVGVRCRGDERALRPQRKQQAPTFRSARCLLGANGEVLYAPKGAVCAP